MAHSLDDRGIWGSIPTHYFRQDITVAPIEDIVRYSGWQCYDKVGSIPHAIAGMHHVICNPIPHDHMSQSFTISDLRPLSVPYSGWQCYDKVGSIPHAIAGMHHVICNPIPHDHMSQSFTISGQY